VNDFLTRVVQRHRGEVPTVRPRLAPLFAPGVESAADQVSEELTWPQPATIASEPTSTGIQEHRAKQTAEPESLIGPPRPPIVNRVVDVRSPVGRPDSESASDAPRRQAPVEQSRPVSHQHRPGPERMVIPTSASAESRAASDAVTTLTQKMVTERVTHSEQVEVIPRLVNQDTARARPIDAPPSLVSSVSPRPFDGIDRDTAEPPVQVTIGRIEVTAVAAPPAPKRKAAPRQPSMSLEEYLARRQDKGVSR
jgi:hypothetical protein